MSYSGVKKHTEAGSGFYSTQLRAAINTSGFSQCPNI